MLTIVLIILILALVLGGFGTPDWRNLLWVVAAVVLIILLARIL